MDCVKDNILLIRVEVWVNKICMKKKIRNFSKIELQHKNYKSLYSHNLLILLFFGLKYNI